MAPIIPPDRAAIGRQRALEVRRRRANERLVKAATVAAVVDEVGCLAPAALRAVLDLVVRVRDAVDEGVPIETPLDALRAVQTAEILHRIARLAANKSTSNIAHASLTTDEERADRIAQLRQRLAQLDGIA